MVWPEAANKAFDTEIKITARNHRPLLWLDYTLLFWQALSVLVWYERRI